MSRITRVEHLPNWFNLSNYEPAKYFDYLSWVINFEVRRDKAYQKGLVSPEDILGRMLVEKFKEKAAKIYENMINGVCVEPMSRADIIYLSEESIKNHEEYEAKGDDFFRGEGAEPYDEYSIRKEEGTVIASEGTVFAAIDLNAADEQVVRDFRDWLSRTRSRLEIWAPKKPITPTQMHKWYSTQVLPYMDLTEWAASEGCQIPQHVLGEALFPPSSFDGDSTEKIRKGTIPQVKKIKENRLDRIIWWNRSE